MRSPIRKLSFAAVGLALLALAGCGGGSSSDETTAAAPVETTESTPTLSKQELITQGDAICAEVNAAVGTAEAGEVSAASQVSQSADLYSGMVERLKELGTPDEAEGYEEFAESAEALSQAESDAQLASERGDEEGLATAQSEASSALASFQEAAAAYGFEDCAEAPEAPEVTSPSTGAGGVEEEVEVTPEEVAPEEVAPEEVAPEEVAPETGGAGGTGGGAVAPAPETGGGTSGGIGPG